VCNVNERDFRRAWPTTERASQEQRKKRKKSVEEKKIPLGKKKTVFYFSSIKIL
jgi:hypothetical protein